MLHAFLKYRDHYIYCSTHAVLQLVHAHCMWLSNIEVLASLNRFKHAQWLNTNMFEWHVDTEGMTSLGFSLSSMEYSHQGWDRGVHPLLTTQSLYTWEQSTPLHLGTESEGWAIKTLVGTCPNTHPVTTHTTDHVMHSWLMHHVQKMYIIQGSSMYNV
jgi:hypothetical protein